MVDRYRNYHPQRHSRQVPRKKHRGLFMFILALLVFFGGKTLLAHRTTDSTRETTTSTIPKPKKTVKAEPISSNTWNDLSQKVNAVINENPSLNIAVAVVDINTNTSANYGIQDNFAGASTTKVLTAVAYLHDVETGKRTLTEKFSGATAQVHLRRMINQSNNESWEALNTAVGSTRLELYAHEHGISSYKYYGNLMTSSDQALLLSKLYKQEFLNESNTRLLLSFMQNTNNETMIPAVKPSGSTLYHKYGQLEDRLHDSAIIVHNNRPIVLAIYTKGGASDGSNYTSRTKLIQSLATTVFSTVYNEGN